MPNAQPPWWRYIPEPPLFSWKMTLHMWVSWFIVVISIVIAGYDFEAGSFGSAEAILDRLGAFWYVLIVVMIQCPWAFFTVITFPLWFLSLLWPPAWAWQRRLVAISQKGADLVA